jgi:Protein of unknown function (DUF1045)
LTPAEIARRRPETLTPRQRALLDVWGYPYVMEEFQFHLTLTGPLSAADLATTAEALAPHLLPILPRPFALQEFCLCGEDDGGMFHIIRRYAFSG